MRLKNLPTVIKFINKTLTLPRYAIMKQIIKHSLIETIPTETETKTFSFKILIKEKNHYLLLQCASPTFN